MTKPNLFSFATSELTQDAFLAYLLAWANPAVAESDSAMHQAGTEFLRLLLALHGLQLTTVNKLDVQVQVRNIDILVYLEMQGEGGIALVIEDKVHAGSYNDLRKYLAAAELEYPTSQEIKGIYLRTGNQADYTSIEAENFRVLHRGMMLSFLQDEKTGNPSNAIFQDYRSYLGGYQEKIDAYKTLPVKEWNGNAWVGFFSQVLFPDKKLLFNDFGYVANPSGGFQGCWWTTDCRPTFGGYSVYLQIDGSNTEEEKSWIKVKLETLNTAEANKMGLDRIDLIRRLADCIEAYPEAERCGLKRPKLRAGQWMTAAYVTPALELNPEHPDHSLRQLHDLQSFIFQICQ